VAHWLNRPILCKRGGVSNVTHAVACASIYRNLSTQKTGQRIVSTSIQLTFQSGVLCNRSCRLSLEVPRRWFS